MEKPVGITFNIGALQMMTAREVYGQTLVEMGKKNKDILVMTADLARTNKTGLFRDAFPERFINVGIAEQDLMGMAAGLALKGKIPFVSTFGAFASMRDLDQVHSDIAYMGLNVNIVATHCGVTSTGGTTHNALLDLAIMRALPNMTVIVPGDPAQVGKAVEQVADIQGPSYIRIGRGMEPVVYKEEYDYDIGKAITIKEGKDIAIIACGIGVANALGACEKLEKDGIRARVIDMHTIKPLDKETVLKAGWDVGKILTVEEHYVSGGLGSAVAEIIADEKLNVDFKRLGIPEVFSGYGAPEALYAKYGFDADGIYHSAKEML